MQRCRKKLGKIVRKLDEEDEEVKGRTGEGSEAGRMKEY